MNEIERRIQAMNEMAEARQTEILDNKAWAAEREASRTIWEGQMTLGEIILHRITED